MARGGRELASSVVVCEVCGTEYQLQRLSSKRKRSGHAKHVWCITCQATTLHVEKKDK